MQQGNFVIKKDMNAPDSKGRFGPYGGVYVAETLVPALEAVSYTHLTLPTKA